MGVEGLLCCEDADAIDVAISVNAWVSAFAWLGLFCLQTSVNIGAHGALSKDLCVPTSSISVHSLNWILVNLPWCLSFSCWMSSSILVFFSYSALIFFFFFFTGSSPSDSDEESRTSDRFDEVFAVCTKPLHQRTQDSPFSILCHTSLRSSLEWMQTLGFFHVPHIK